MREIKFRAWLPEGEWEENGEKQKYIMVYDLAYEEYLPINDLLNNTENLMQYTGLKDKNGKEIYEGDIIDFKGKWDRARGVIKYDNEKCGYIINVALDNQNLNDCEIGGLFHMGQGKDKNVITKVELREISIVDLDEYSYGYHQMNGWKTIEVIGNIHENPELLENNNERD